MRTLSTPRPPSRALAFDYTNAAQILETLCRRLEMVDDPLLLRLSAMTTGGKAQVGVTWSLKSDPAKVLTRTIEVPCLGGVRRLVTHFPPSFLGNHFFFFFVAGFTP